MAFAGERLRVGLRATYLSAAGNSSTGRKRYRKVPRGLEIHQV